MISYEDNTGDWLILVLSIAVLILSIFAGTLINQVPAEECLKTKDGTCKVRAIIWQGKRWMEVE